VVKQSHHLAVSKCDFSYHWHLPLINSIYWNLHHANYRNTQCSLKLLLRSPCRFVQLVKVGLVVLGTFAICWLPFLQYPEDTMAVVHRLFPFNRGLFEVGLSRWQGWWRTNIDFGMRSTLSYLRPRLCNNSNSYNTRSYPVSSQNPTSVTPYRCSLAP